MTRKDDSGLYMCDEGKLFVRKSDGKVMGDGIDLGADDSIDNYEERAFAEGEIAGFRRQWGMVERPQRPARRDSPGKEGANGRQA